MITLEVDPRKLLGVMAGMEKQLPFATAKALNECAVAFQQDERQLIQKEFIVRRPWVLQGVKINRADFARKDKFDVRVHIDPSRDFFNKFEKGGIRTPRQGKSLTVPINARSQAKSVVPAKLRPRNLQFTAVGNGVSGTKILRGAHNTFMIQRPDGSGVIMQRKGRKVALKRRQHGPLMRGERRDHALVVLYVLRPKTPLPDSLHFLDTARKSFAANWPIAFSKWWNESVRTANTGRVIEQGMALPQGWTA